MSDRCPFCKADDENILVRILPRRPFDEDQRECAQCGCEWDATQPDVILSFAYDDPRQPSEAAP